MGKKKFDELMDWENKDDKGFSDELMKVISAVEDWKAKLERRGYIVNFLATFFAYNPETNKDTDSIIRVYGNRGMCYLSLEYLLRKINEEKLDWVDDQKKGGKK